MLPTDLTSPMGFSHPMAFSLFLFSCQFPLPTKVLMEGNNMVAILGSVYTRDPVIPSSILNSF